MILNFLFQKIDLNKPKTDEKHQSKDNKEVLNTDIKHTQSDITKNQEVTEVENTNTLAQLLNSETKDSKPLLNLETNITNLEKDTVIDCTVTPGNEDTLDWSITSNLVEDDDQEDKDNITKGESAIDWALTEDLYNELPDLTEEEPKLIIDNILSQDIKPIDKKDIKVKNMQQYFIDGELAYPLSEEICVQVDNVLGDLTTPQIMTEVLERDTLKLNKLMLRIKQKLERSEEVRPIIKEITPQVAARLTIKALAQKHTTYILKRHQNDEKININDIIFPTNEIATTIGNLIIETYVYKMVLYKSTNKPIIISTSKYRKAITYKRTSDSEILKIIKGYNKLQKPNELLEIIMSYIMLYAKENNILTGTTLQNFNKEKHETSLQKTAQSLGVYLINVLVMFDIIENININLSKERTNIPHIKIKHNILQEILATPLSYNKPKISTNPRPDYLVIEENEIIDIIITTRRKSKIFQSTNQDKIIPTDTFNEIKKAYNGVPHSINQQIYNDILELYIKVLTITTNKLDNPLIIQFFKSIYFIDLEPIIKENYEDLNTLETLVTYGLSFNIPDLDNLKTTVKKHSSFNNIYNKITAYKFILKGLLNDCNFFRHFAYFYIEKSPTSSGRLHSDVFFLQTQGYKLTLSVLDFYTLAPLTETEYKAFIPIVKAVIPAIKIPPKVENNYKDYQQQNKNLYVKQITSMFKFQNLEQFKEYTLISTKEEKLTWISTRIKKAKEIWIAYNLLEGYINQTFLTTSYQKQDATSSAIQLIGLLKNDPFLCKQSNITGKDYNDIYMQFIILLEKDIKQLINMRKTIINPLLEKYKDGNPNEQITYELLTNDVYWREYKKDKKMTFEKKIHHDEQILAEIKNIRYPFINIVDLKTLDFNDHDKILFALKEYIKAAKLLLLIPYEMLINRNLVKKLIMTKGYNAGKKLVLIVSWTISLKLYKIWEKPL
jgi:hypothetical protein